MSYEVNIKKFKNELLGVDSLDINICQSLKNKILNSEQYILDLGIPNYPNVSPNTITSRHQYYNLLDFKWSELEFVKESIINHASKIIGGDKFLIKMWANIFRHNECIKRHMHHPSPIRETDNFKKNVFNTICGNLFLNGDYESHTIYYFEQKRKEILNKSGEIYYFSCIVEHEVLPFKGNLRVGLAFDIYTVNFFENMGLSNPIDLRLISRI
jgi:hypothetical protein